MTDGTTKVIEKYSYATWLDEYVWNQPEWRQDDVWLAALDRLMEAFDDAIAQETGSFYASDLDFEKFGPLASLKGKQIASPFVRVFNRLTAAAIRAKYIKSPPDLQRPAAPEPSAPAAPAAEAPPPAVNAGT